MEAPAREGRAQVPADGANASQPTVIPAANFFDFADGPTLPARTTLSSRSALAAAFTRCCLRGYCRGALDELVALANTGRQQQRAAVPMRDSETFQFELGRVAAEVRAARAFLDGQARSHWRHALSGTLKGEVLFMEGAQTAIWLVTTCVRIAERVLRARWLAARSTRPRRYSSGCVTFTPRRSTALCSNSTMSPPVSNCF